MGILVKGDRINFQEETFNYSQFQESAADDEKYSGEEHTRNHTDYPQTAKKTYGKNSKLGRLVKWEDSSSSIPTATNTITTSEANIRAATAVCHHSQALEINHGEHSGSASGGFSSINLDVTAAIAWVSDVTNFQEHQDSRSYTLPDPVLNQMIEDETCNPALKILHNVCDGKELIMCNSAWNRFQNILQTLGGARERERAQILASQIQVIPDQPSSRASSLPLSGRIRAESRIVFGTGDTMRAPTLTANSAFVRAAENKGVVFSVFLHPARALSEVKRLQTHERRPHHQPEQEHRG